MNRHERRREAATRRDGWSALARGPNEGKFWWLAINGASCAACFIDVEIDRVEVSPMPEQLVGFRNQEEQLRIQRFMLSAPIEEVGRYVKSLPSRIDAGEVGYLRPTHPEPPTSGETAWLLTPSGPTAASLN